MSPGGNLDGILLNSTWKRNLELFARRLVTRRSKSLRLNHIIAILEIIKPETGVCWEHYPNFQFLKPNINIEILSHSLFTSKTAKVKETRNFWENFNLSRLKLDDENIKIVYHKKDSLINTKQIQQWTPKMLNDTLNS